MDSQKSTNILLKFRAEFLKTIEDTVGMCYCEIEIKENINQPWKALGETEKLTITPILDWEEELSVLFKFQQKQELRICLFENQGDQRLVLGIVEVQLSKLLNPVNNINLFNVNNEHVAYLIIRCEESADVKKKLNLVLANH